MGAETHALVEGAEAVDWARPLMCELSAPSAQLGGLVDGTVGTILVKWLDDAKGLVSHLHNDAGQVSDRRLRVVMAALREMLQQEGASLQWCNTSLQPADALTKRGLSGAICWRLWGAAQYP